MTTSSMTAAAQPSRWTVVATTIAPHTTLITGALYALAILLILALVARIG